MVHNPLLRPFLSAGGYVVWRVGWPAAKCQEEDLWEQQTHWVKLCVDLLLSKPQLMCKICRKTDESWGCLGENDVCVDAINAICVYITGCCAYFRNERWMCLKIIGKFAERNNRTSKFLAFVMSSFHSEDHHVCQTTMWFIDHVPHHVLDKHPEFYLITRWFNMTFWFLTCTLNLFKGHSSIPNTSPEELPAVTSYNGGFNTHK